MQFLNSLVLLEAWLMVLNTFHFGFTVLFVLTFARILLQKYSPYSQMYTAAFLSVQVLWNGCPVAAFLNIFNNLGNYTFEYNGFFFGGFLEWTEPVKILSIFMSGLLYWSAFETWHKQDMALDFSSYFKNGDFKMENQTTGQSEFQTA